MKPPVPVELVLLAGGAAFGIAQIVYWAHLGRKANGMWWAATPRDEPTPPLTGVAGRVERAFKNYMETFPFFAAAVLAATAAGRLGGLSLMGAHMYLWGRVAYLPLYASGVPLVRSLAWNVATIGILLVLGALFL